MKLDRRLIITDDQILHVELGALRKNLPQFGECSCYEGLLAKVVTGKRVCPLYNPVHIVGYMLEEGSAVAVFKSLEDIANAIGCNSHLDFSFSWRSILRGLSGNLRLCGRSSCSDATE